MKRFLFIIGLSIFITACHSSKGDIKVGTIDGPETDLMRTAIQVAKQNDQLQIKIITFSDYLQPNTALNDGSINANMFQHRAYLETQIKQHGYNLAIACKTFIYPMGLYSAKYKTLDELPDNAIVAIPNDPTNEGRALLLLQHAGLIRINPASGSEATPNDITQNNKHLQFKELDAADITRAYHDVALATINTNYAIPAGLMPSRDALAVENTDSPYANVLVVRQGDIGKPWVHPLCEALHSKAVLDQAKILFNGQAIPAWTQAS
ncbi:MAG: MetQ/NlpA family ABC transporter substrate-binding protein [Gammaproteobacteria bacterium]